MIIINKIKITTEFLSCATEGKLAEYLTGFLQFENIKNLHKSELIPYIRHLVNDVEECKVTNSEIAAFMSVYDYDILKVLDEQVISPDEIIDHLILEILNHTKIELTVEYDD